LSLFYPYRKTRGIEKASSNSKGFAAGWTIAICAPDAGHGTAGSPTLMMKHHVMFWLVLLMLGTSLTHIKVVPKLVISLP
jgi:hypothetical protein